MKEKSMLGYVFGMLFESRTCEIAMLYPDGQCKMDSWVCLWIPKVNIVPTQKWGVSRGGARFLCVSPRAPRRGGVPQNAPSKGVLDLSTPLNGGHIYWCNNNDGTPSRFGRIGRESEQIAPPPIFSYKTQM